MTRKEECSEKMNLQKAAENVSIFQAEYITMTKALAQPEVIKM
jgi:hypothetical protein